MAVSSVTYNKPVLPRVSDTSDLASNRASVYSGKGLSFDGVNDHVGVDSSFMPDNADFSVSLYVKINTIASPRAIIGSWDSSYNGFAIGISSGRLRSWANDGANSGLTYVESDDLVAGIYYHIILSYDYSTGTQTGYLNGVNIGSDTYPDTMTHNAFNIAKAMAGYSYGNVDISDVRVYNSIVTDAQAKEIYDNPEQPIPTGFSSTNLILHLPMTEGAGYYVNNANAGALGTELISNAGFDETCQKWGTTDNSTVAIVDGKAVWTNAPLSGSFVEQPLALEAGKFYRVKFDYTSTAFNIFVNLGNSQQAVPLGDGTFVYDMYYGSGSSSLKFQHGWSSNSSATVDNVSVKEVVPRYFFGSISGATWVNGIGEPVPQTALIDWNKYPFFDGVGDRYYSTSSMKNFNTISGGGVTAYCRVILGDKVGSNQNFFSWGDNDGYRIRFNDSNYFEAIQKGGGNVLTSTTTGVRGQLHTVVGAVDANGSRLYLDGILIASNTTAFSNPTSADNLTIAAYSSTNELFDGSVIDVKFWEYGMPHDKASALSGNLITPESLTDYEIAHFDGANDYEDKLGNYSGIFSTKEVEYRYLVPSGSTSGKDIFENAIAKPRSAGAFNFDGSSWVTLKDNSSVTISGDLTLEGWVNPSFESSTSWETLFSKTSQSTFQLFINNSGILSHYDVSQGDITLSTTVFNDNEWNHFAVVQSGSSLLGYVNGVLEITRSSRTLTMSSAGDLTIGKLTGSSDYHNGQMSNPRIYDFALTAEQVADNYNQKSSTVGAAKTESELQAYINRTVAAGATVEDHANLLNTLTELDSKSGCL